MYWGATLHGKRKYGGSHGDVCQICGNRGNEHQEPHPTELLLCDYCPFAAHYRCINEPPIYKVPSGDWSCARCNQLYHEREQKRQAEKQRVRDINEKRRLEAMEARSASARSAPPAKRGSSNNASWIGNGSVSAAKQSATRVVCSSSRSVPSSRRI